MKIAEIHRRALEIGREADPRGPEGVSLALKRVSREYDELSKAERESFDSDRLNNPYPDTRILYGDPETEVHSLLVGIDIEVGEVLLADRLRERGKEIDLLLSHHPEGIALSGFHRVMDMQADILGGLGVPINLAEALLEKRIGEVERRVMPANLSRAVDAARLLGIPFACVHTPADNCVARFLQETLDRVAPATVGEVVEAILEVPEYAIFAGEGSPPRVIAGKRRRRAGKVFVDMTGGTEGSPDACAPLARTGVGTMVVMHMSEKLLKVAAKQHLNVVVAGHMASDSLGLNLLLDRLDPAGELAVAACSGFRRVNR